jgi:GLPGLI family protein
MKMKYLVSLFIQTVFLAMLAQVQGKIVYEDKMDMHRRLPPDRAEMKDMIPQFRTSKFELYYTEDASIYKEGEKAEDQEVSGTQGNAHFRMRMTSPHRQVYKSILEDKMVDEREFMTKMFLIKGKASPLPWKIGDGQKKVLEYACMQALYQDSTANYVAWFTPQIPVSNGPDEYGGLPGMIMQVDINNGERIITAIEVSNEEVDAGLLQEPTKGKEVTQEEFREIRREKQKEMEAMNGGGPQIMIRHN